MNINDLKKENNNFPNSTKIYFNGKIYTADEKQKEAAAFVVENNKFIYVGNDEGALDFKEKADEIHDIKGKRVLPGFIDTHCHYIAINLKDRSKNIHIDYKMSHEEVLDLIRDVVKNNSIEEMPILLGMGYGNKCIPLATELDKAVNDRPAFIWNMGGHSAWANTKTMETIGLDKNTPDPKPGICYFSRDEEGNPTGEAIENDAVMYVEKKLKTGSTEILKKQLPEMNHILNSYGYTSVYDAGFLLRDEREVLESMKNMDLTVRYFTSFYYDGHSDKKEFLEEMKECRDLYSSDMIRPTTLKMFKDGTLETQAGLMFEDYCKHGEGRGTETLTHDQLFNMGSIATKENFNIHIHTIGDAAVRDVLDVYKEIGNIEGTKTTAHNQVLANGDEKRFANENVFYQTTPVWLEADKFTEEILGKQRYKRQIPLKSVKDAGAILTFGSDAPASGGMLGINPFNNICFAVNRGKDLKNIPQLIAPPTSEVITVEDCVDAYTINGAKQLGVEKEIGTISKGKSADFMILKQDILNMPTEKIYKTEVQQTYLKGNLVFNNTN